MHFVLACYGPPDRDRAAIGIVRNTKVNWQLGRRFTDPPPSPVVVDLNQDFPGILLPMFDKGILLLADEMVASLRAGGVDNLDLYDTRLFDPQNGQTYYNYKAVNIIGAVAAADLGKSNYSAPSGTALVDTDFDSLAIDEKKAKGLLMFRLAECVTAIIIDERVRQQLERDKIPYLDFLDPKDWMG
jgi:hypothetical protein